MPVKRRLDDLFTTGKEVSIDDGQGEVKVWLQKLNPIETQTAIRKANAARARVLSLRNKQDSEEYMALWLEVLDFKNKEELVSYLLAETTLRARERAEEQVAKEEEWAKDNYLQGLRDSWIDTLQERHALDPDDETRRVLAELQRFASEAEALAEPEIEAARANLEETPLESLQEEAMQRVIQYHANTAWLDELHRQEVFYSVREPDDHRKYYFQDRADIDRLSLPVLQRLMAAYSELAVDVMEGKELPPSPTSSTSSESPGEAAQAPSGLAVVGL